MRTNQRQVSHKGEVLAFWQTRMKTQVSVEEVSVPFVVGEIGQDQAMGVHHLVLLWVFQSKL